MVMLKLASDDPRKRAMQGPPITPIQAPRPVAPPKDESVTARFAQAAMNRGIDTAVEGGASLAKKYGAPMLQKGMGAMTATAPTMAQMTGPTSALVGAGPGAGNALMQGGAQAAGAAGAGASTGLMSSLGAAGTAAMASPAAPIIGGLLAMKMLGFFSEGGHVGPLYASKGRKAVEGESIKDQLMPYLMDKYIEEQDKIKDEIEQSKYKYAGGIAGPLSKLSYKSAGGEVITMSYGGSVTKGV